MHRPAVDAAHQFGLRPPRIGEGPLARHQDETDQSVVIGLDPVEIAQAHFRFQRLHQHFLGAVQGRVRVHG